MNENYICIKVDREERPDVDQLYMDACNLMIGRGGWPLNVFITPQGHPLHATLYLPPDQFLSVLQRITKLWTEDSQSLAQSAQAADSQPAEPLTAWPRDRSATTLVADLLTAAHKLVDPMQGGFGEQSKFPMVPQWEFLLRYYERKPDEQLKAVLLLSLDQMVQRALQDHLSGGFFRYTVDPGWNEPH